MRGTNDKLEAKFEGLEYYNVEGSEEENDDMHDNSITSHGLNSSYSIEWIQDPS